MFIVSKPEEIIQAEEEQQEAPKGDGGLLDFTDLDNFYFFGRTRFGKRNKRVGVYRIRYLPTKLTF